jgi:hypothetical protein
VSIQCAAIAVWEYGQFAEDAGTNSYRSIHSFIDVDFVRLREFFRLKWRRTPAYTTIRNIVRQLDPASVEQALRRHAAILDEQSTPPGQWHIAVDGKALRQSLEAFQDRKAASPTDRKSFVFCAKGNHHRDGPRQISSRSSLMIVLL